MYHSNFVAFDDTGEFVKYAPGKCTHLYCVAIKSYLQRFSLYCCFLKGGQQFKCLSDSKWCL